MQRRPLFSFFVLCQLLAVGSAFADELTFKMRVQFGLASSRVADKYRGQLKWVAEFMRKYPNCTVTVHGHADSTGNKAFNRKLSLRRAEAVRQFVITQFGIAKDRLSVEGHGDSTPDADDKTAAGQAANRRVTTAIANDKPGAFAGLKKEIVIYDSPAVVFEAPASAPVVAKRAPIVLKPAPEPMREVAAVSQTSVDPARERCPLDKQTCLRYIGVGIFAAHHQDKFLQFKSGSVVSVAFGWYPQLYRTERFTITGRLGQFLLHDQDGGSFVAIESGAFLGYDLSPKWTISLAPLVGYWTQSEVKGFSPGGALLAEWHLGLDAGIPKVGFEYTYWDQAVASVHMFRLNLGLSL